MVPKLLSKGLSSVRPKWDNKQSTWNSRSQLEQILHLQGKYNTMNLANQQITGKQHKQTYI